MLPSYFPKWHLGYYYFNKWSRDGTFEEIHEVLLKRLCLKRGWTPSPSVGIIDTQSIRTTKVDGECRVFDGAKRIKCRK